MKKQIYIVSLLLAATLSSCNEWLDVKLETEQREKDLFTGYKGYKEALSGCYTSMASRSIYGDNLTMSKIENLACLWEEPSADYLPAEHYFHHHEYNNDKAEAAINSIYTGLFKVVAQANKIIAHVRTDGGVIKDPAARNMVEGEAYALRAYCQFDVLRLFGQMPQNATIKVSLPYAENADIKNFPAYYDYDSYLSKLEHDLDRADSLLKISDPVATRTMAATSGTMDGIDDDFMTYRQLRLNYWAVKALKARFYQYTGKTAKAHAQAMEIINAQVNGKWVISLSGTEDTRTGYYALPNECLFLLSNPAMIDYSIDVLGGDITGDFDDNTQLHITNNMLLLQLYAGKNTASDNRYLRVWERNTTNSSSKVCPTIKKYYYNTNASNMLTTLRTKLQIVPMIRLSEIYLMAMETTESLGEANMLYKEYMASHNVSITNDFTSLDEVRQEMVNEYRREFYGEGVMFYTYKRLGTKNMLWNTKEMGESQYILPLPSTEFDPNK